ncbi:Endonuclease G, mitochondrial, partial [Fragariocoptes setiger]
MATGILKLCTAALAGTLLGLSYERLGKDIISWPSFEVAHAATPVIRDQREINQRPAHHNREPIKTDPILSAENFKHLAKYGFPSNDNIRIFDDFILSYDRRLRAAAWTFEHLTPAKLAPNSEVDRSKCDFQEDKTIHDFFRASSHDYRNSGYDRGHLAAAGNHKLRQSDVEQTFVLTNISPQKPKFNREAWNKLEKYVRYRANRAKDLYVVTGPLYLPTKESDGRMYVKYEVIGSNHVSVPTHFFKVFAYEMNEGSINLEAFLMPNDNSLNDKVNLADFRVPIDKIDSIERAAGVIFFDRLPRKALQRDLPQIPSKDFA